MDIWGMITTERLAQADEAAGFTDEQWSAPSPCDGWTVRDVIAHLGTEPNPSFGLVVGIVKARFDVDRFIAQDAIDVARSMSPDELVDRLRGVATSRKLAPGVKPPGQLVDNIVHAWDIRTALDRPVRQRPAEHYRAALDYAVVATSVFRGRSRAEGLRWSATDIDWTHGDGPEVSGGAEALLATLIGREGTLAELSGDGVTTLADRVG